MNISKVIGSYSGQPLTHQLLMHWLKDYKRPNDKIKSLKAEGVIESVKKGLYIPGPSTSANRPESGLLANHILGPSYVSMDSALSYYNLIPERVYEITSMTTKASRTFHTPMGIFSYRHLGLPYYAFGLKMVNLSANERAIIASPEKALCDKIIDTSGLILRSIVNASKYLLEDLRMEEQDLKEFDTGIMADWLSAAPKKESLTMVIKMINSL